MAGIRIYTGELRTPDGTPYKGFKVTIGGITDPETIKRSYEDIEKILKGSRLKYKEHEEKTPDGKFKSYSVSTG